MIEREHDPEQSLRMASAHLRDYCTETERQLAELACVYIRRAGRSRAAAPGPCRHARAAPAHGKGARPEMTEREWLSSADPHRMLAWITCAGPSGDGERDLERWRNRPSDGKLRAVCHALLAPLRGEHGDYPSLPADWLRGWLGHPDAGERAWVANLLREVLGNPWRPLSVEVSPGAWLVPTVKGTGELTYRQRNHPTVLGIAQRAYDEGDFAALPILADALEEAGCDSETLLRHLRGQERCLTCAVDGGEAYPVGWCPVCDGTEDEMNGGWMPLRGPHVRGCWALDTILGKDGVP